MSTSKNWKRSLIRERRERHAVCDVCRSPDYTMDSIGEVEPKPHFTCRQCGNEWQYGTDGGVYAELASCRAYLLKNDKDVSASRKTTKIKFS
jgi:transposase-like protein